VFVMPLIANQSSMKHRMASKRTEIAIAIAPGPRSMHVAGDRRVGLPHPPCRSASFAATFHGYRLLLATF